MARSWISLKLQGRSHIRSVTIIQDLTTSQCRFMRGREILKVKEAFRLISSIKQSFELCGRHGFESSTGNVLFSFLFLLHVEIETMRSCVTIRLAVPEVGGIKRVLGVDRQLVLLRIGSYAWKENQREAERVREFAFLEAIGHLNQTNMTDHHFSHSLTTFQLFEFTKPPSTAQVATSRN